MVMGRPKIDINFEELEKLCGLQCTLIEIASFFGCSEDTIERRIKEEYDTTFADYYKNNSAYGRISLRRAQYKAAIDGNTSMLIWMGKQLLGQSDQIKSEHEHSFNVTRKEYKPSK